MFDGMSMPVLFMTLIVVLAAVSVGVLVAVRVLAEHDGPRARRPVPSRAQGPTDSDRAKELD